jgi:orotate phosphoribosyltransferase-like protein
VGRPRRELDAADLVRLAALAARGLAQVEIARELHLDAKTLRRILGEDEAAAGRD